MANTIPFPTFNWKAQDQIRAWEIFEAKAKLWLAGEEIKKELQYTKIVLMLGEEGLNRWTKFQMTEENKKDPDNVFAEFRKSLGKDISYRTARATLYNSFRQKKDETAAELDLRLSKLIEECKFPGEVKEFLKTDIFINAINYYEVKKWVAKQKEDGPDALTYQKVMDKCKEYEATVRDYIFMANDNSQLQTAYQKGTTSLDSNSFKKHNRHKSRPRRNRSHSGSREHKPAIPKHTGGSKCKRCGFECHTTPDGSCPALKTTCGFCNRIGHYESACITKCTEQKRESRGRQKPHSPNRRRGATPGPAGKKSTVNAHTVNIRTSDQMKADFQRIHFDSISTRTTTPQLKVDAITMMDTAKDGKTYVLTQLDVKLPNRPGRDTLKVKLDMGAEANILPVRTYRNMFPERMLADGTPDPEYLQSTNIEFECNKDSIIRSLGCINLDIALPGKKMITAQFFLSNHHNQVLIGHPSCDRLGAYTLHMKNLAPKFDQNKLLPQLSEVQQTAPEEGPITRVEDLMRRYPDRFDVIGKFEGEYHMVTDPNVPPSQHAMRKVPIEYQEKIEKELD